MAQRPEERSQRLSHLVFEKQSIAEATTGAQSQLIKVKTGGLEEGGAPGSAVGIDPSSAAVNVKLAPKNLR